jgi:hypothetical protein
MVGNAFESTRASSPDLGAFVILEVPGITRNGTFIPNRQAFTAASHDVTVGVRLCAPPRR